MFTKRNYCVGIIIFVAVWALILAAPKTRALFYSQMWRTNLWGISGFFKPVAENKAIENLAKKHPDDPQIQAALVQNASINASNNAEYHLYHIHEYDKLINRFPKATWLITDRLRESAGKFNSLKGAYFIVDNNRKIYLDSKNWMSDDEIQKTLQIAELGEKRDDNNSFYNWIEAMCWYGLNDGAKALDALQRGSHKTAFDDGILQYTKNQFYVRQLVTYPLLEDRWMTWISPILLHLNVLQAINQNAIWQGAMEENSGNHRKALEIYGAQIRLNATIIKNSPSIVTRLVAQAMLVPSWIAFNRKKALDGEHSYGFGLGNSPKKRKVLLSAARNFADYASTHHRADLAQESINIVHSIVDDPDFSGNLSAYLPFLPLDQLNQIGKLKWSGMELLAILCMGIFFSFCIFPLSFLLRKTVNLESAWRQMLPRYFDIALCLMFVFLSVITGTIFVLLKTPPINKVDLFLSLFSNQLVQNEGAYGSLYFLTIWIPRIIFILLFAWCFVSSFWKMRKSTFTHNDIPSNNLFVNRILNIAGWGIFWLIGLSMEAWWIKWIVMLPAGSIPLINHVIFLAIPIPLILFLILYWHLQRSQFSGAMFSTRAYWLLIATWLQHSLALLVLICMLAYGVTSWTSLPSRHDANKQLDHILKVGEVTALREAIQRVNAERSEKTE